MHTRELYPSPLKKAGLGFGSSELRYGFAADVNAIASNRGSELLLMTYYLIKCVFQLTFVMSATDLIMNTAWGGDRNSGSDQPSVKAPL